MTWPFENDTSGIVKRISNRSISANRKRNIFIVLTIVLSGFYFFRSRNVKFAEYLFERLAD